MFHARRSHNLACRGKRREQENNRCHVIDRQLGRSDILLRCSSRMEPCVIPCVAAPAAMKRFLRLPKIMPGKICIDLHVLGLEPGSRLHVNRQEL